MAKRRKVVPGLEVLARTRPRWLKTRRVGLLMHQASVTSGLVSARSVLARLCGRQLTALFGPQHGIGGEKQDNMIESGHAVDRELGIPIFSLYSETRRPTPQMLSHIDTLVVDLQDVGTRVYTFEWTTAMAMEACAEAGIALVLLDRPNPIGGILVEGNLVRPGLESFVGLYPVPMRHGLTLGEMALLVNERMARRPGGARCDLTVIPMEGWRRRMRFADTGLPWVLPSPNMPTPDTAAVYPGQVLLEGTNLSEGRGTTRPFEIWGAPFLDAAALAKKFAARRLPGCVLREHVFEPTFHKWRGEVCRGFEIRVTDADRYRPYLTTLALLQDTATLHNKDFEWKEPPYEYVTDRVPIDVIAGDPVVRFAIESGEDLKLLSRGWDREARAFQKESAAHRLYRLL